MSKKLECAVVDSPSYVRSLRVLNYSYVLKVYPVEIAKFENIVGYEWRPI